MNTTKEVIKDVFYIAKWQASDQVYDGWRVIPCHFVGSNVVGAGLTAACCVYVTNGCKRNFIIGFCIISIEKSNA